MYLCVHVRVYVRKMFMRKEKKDKNAERIRKEKREKLIHTDKQTDNQTDGQTDRRTDRQILLNNMYES